MPRRSKARPRRLDVKFWAIKLDQRPFLPEFDKGITQPPARLFADRRLRSARTDHPFLGDELLQGGSCEIHWTSTFTVSTSRAFTRILKITRLLSSGVASCSCSPRPVADSFSRKHARSASAPDRSARAFLTTSIDLSWLSFKFRFWLSSGVCPI